MLEVGYLDDARASEGLLWIASEAPLADIAANCAGRVVGRAEGIRHGPRLHAAHAGAEGIQFAHRR